MQLPEYREITGNSSISSGRTLKFSKEREQPAWDKAHESLSQKFSALQFGGDKERVDLQYLGLDQLREDPVSPHKLKLLYASLALGLAVAFAVPFALDEQFDDTSAKLEEIEHSLNLCGLGIVPLVDPQDLEEIANRR